MRLYVRTATAGTGAAVDLNDLGITIATSATWTELTSETSDTVTGTAGGQFTAWEIRNSADLKAAAAGASLEVSTDGSTNNVGTAYDPDIVWADFLKENAVDISAGSLKLPQGLSTPGSGTEGQIFWETDVDTLWIHNGSTWINPSGTASVATTVTLTATNTTNATHFITFVDTATGNEDVRTDTDLTYNPSTNTLTVVNLAGNASTATLASTVTVADAAADTTTWVMLAGTAATGTNAVLSDASLTFNASTNALSTTTFIGALTGNADTATTATTATNVTVVDAASDTTTWVLLATTAATGSNAPSSDAQLTYNASTNNLTTTTFTGALVGNADSATVATTVTLVADNTTNATNFLTFVDTATGNENIRTDTGLTYNPSTGVITSTNFTGSVTGTASTATVATTVTLTATNTTAATHFITFVDTATGNEDLRTDTDLTWNPNTNTLVAANVTGNASTATTATHIAGGAASQVVYQTGSGATGFIANGTAGQFLKSAGASVPVWAGLTEADVVNGSTKRARAATTANVTLASAAPSTLDGVTLAANDIILVKDQSTASQNGLYFVQTLGTGANGVWVRTTDTDTSAEIAGLSVVVSEGTVAGGTTWSTNFKATDTINTTSLAWKLHPGQTGYGVAGGVIWADSTTSTASLAAGTAGQPLLSGAGATPTWGTLGLTYGGTNAALTASNGGIVYSTATALAVLAGTATAGQIIRSGSSAAPSWSTATYPATTTANRLLYSSATNVIGEITSANNSVLVTDGSGVPSWSATIPTATQNNIDHGNLTGLGDDDHPQYFAIAQNETVTGLTTFSPSTGTVPAMVIVPDGSTPSTSLADGAITVMNGMMYIYDSGRSKFLSTTRQYMNAGRNHPAASNLYLRIYDGLPTSVTGYRVLRNATITAIWAQADASSTWTFEVRKNSSVTVITSVGMTAVQGNSATNINIDITAGDELQFFCNGTSINTPLGGIEIAWRV